MADDGPLQLSLLDEQDLAEITCDDFPGERLVACRNPVLAAERARKRADLLAATEKLLAPLIARVAAGRLRGADAIGLAAGKVISTYKTAKHFGLTITDTSLTIERRQDQIDAEAALDGFYVLRPPSRPASSTRPASSPRTRTSNTPSGTSATSKPATWTCARSSTGSESASKPTC